MIFTETRLPGAYIIDLEKRVDERGFFARTWCQKEFEDHNLVSSFVQSNLSYNRKKGTLRGMHFQRAPRQECKLIRCARGAIYMVIVDIRPESPTHRQWLPFELKADSYRSLFVPGGFAVGFITLEDDCEIVYQMSEFFAPDYGSGIRYNDPAFGIKWPIPVSVIAEKDKLWPDYER